jgi:phage FluMu protein Com
MRTHTTTTTTDCRCKGCDALLAKRDRDGLSIRRGDMQTTVTGADFTVAVSCYRCRALNVLTSRPEPPPTATPARAPVAA